MLSTCPEPRNEERIRANLDASRKFRTPKLNKPLRQVNLGEIDDLSFTITEALSAEIFLEMPPRPSTLNPITSPLLTPIPPNPRPLTSVSLPTRTTQLSSGHQRLSLIKSIQSKSVLAVARRPVAIRPPTARAVLTHTLKIPPANSLRTKAVLLTC